MNKEIHLRPKTLTWSRPRWQSRSLKLGIHSPKHRKNHTCLWLSRTNWGTRRKPNSSMIRGISLIPKERSPLMSSCQRSLAMSYSPRRLSRPTCSFVLRKAPKSENKIQLCQWLKSPRKLERFGKDSPRLKNQSTKTWSSRTSFDSKSKWTSFIAKDFLSTLMG